MKAEVTLQESSIKRDEHVKARVKSIQNRQDRARLQHQRETTETGQRA